jgi:transcriptional regulator with XRE-family HTH domain
MTTQRLDQELLAFGQALKSAYERARVSKRKLAADASLDRSAVTRIEQGRQAPKFDKLLLLARAAQATPAELLARIGPQETATELRAAVRARYDGAPAGAEVAEERFAANLRWLREHAQPGLSQEGLGLEAEIDRTSPNRYEKRSMAPPTLRTILKLAAGLGVSPGVLMEGVELTEEPPTPPGTDRRRG